MNVCALGRTAFVACALVALAGCGSWLTQLGPARTTQQGAERRPRSAAVQVCAGSRAGAAQCDLLVRTGVAPSSGPSGPGGGYGPANLQAAYNLPSASQGAGEIVSVVDAYDNPNVASDLAKYRSNFGLPAANFTKYNEKGQTSNYPSPNMGWGLEIDVDVEMVSASCPNCTIYLIEANSNAWSDLEKAATEAVALGAHIVSNSYSGTGANEKYYDTKHVTYLGSAGDSGSGVGDPADFDSVVAVGGTSLLQGGGKKRGWTESALAGGGCTTKPKPPWQHDRTCGFRLANDVAAVADPNPGVAAYDTYGFSGWISVGGTSVPTPLLAGVFGLAGNATEQDGGRTFWEKAHHESLYRLLSDGKYVRYSTGGGWGSPDGVGAF